VNALKYLDERKDKLKENMAEINDNQEICANMMDDLMSKTKEAVDGHIEIVMKILISNCNQLEEHFRGVTCYTDEKRSQFENIPKVRILTEKINEAQTCLKDIKESLDSNEVREFEQLKGHKEYIFKVVKDEKKEYEQSYYLLYQFKKFLSSMIEIKEAKNKQIAKIVKTLKTKRSYYNYELPCVELWDLLYWKYKQKLKNNAAYIDFIKDSKVKYEAIMKTYLFNSKTAYKKFDELSGKCLGLSNYL